MTEVVRIKTAAGHAQRYHVGSSVIGNPGARDAFYERPSRPAELPVEQCPSFDGAAELYRANKSLDWTWYRDLSKESGLNRDEVEDAVHRHVHRETLASFGDPSAMPSFAAAVALASRTEFDGWGIDDFTTSCRRVGRELLAGRKHPGPHFDTAIREAVMDAAE